MKKAISLILALALCLPLMGCGSASRLVEKVEVKNNEYFMVFNSKCDFEHELDDMPGSGIIVISNSGRYIHVYNGSGKQTGSTIDSELWRKYASSGTGSYMHYQSELRFVNDCLTECKNAVPYVAGMEIERNIWYIKRG